MANELGATEIGGGYGSTGTTLAADGDVSTDGDLVVGGDVNLDGCLILSSENHTISTGAITVSASLVTINAESGSTDDLDTINGGATGYVLFLRPSGSVTITLKHGTGNINCPNGSDLALQYQRAIMLYDAAQWHVLAVQ